LKQEIYPIITNGLDVVDSLKLELDVQHICLKMEEDGFPLDIEECNSQVGALQVRIDEVDVEVLPHIPPRPVQKGTTVTKVYKLNGDYTKQCSDWLSEIKDESVGSTTPQLAYGVISGPFNRIEFVPINLGSSKQVNEWLLANGWKPKEWNYKKDKQGKEVKDFYGNKTKTSPKLTEESLADLEELGEAGILIAKRRRLTHKRNQIQGFLRNCREDGTVPSVVNTLGAATGRMTHSKIANVPAPKKKAFYKPMRKVFYAPHKYVVVGADCDQCQVRALAHYMNDLDFMVTVNDPNVDLHEKNAEIADVTRDASKNIYYGYIFGAGIPKTAQQIGCTEAEALIARKKYASALPMIDPLVKALGTFWRKHGYILGIDNRKIYAVSEHILLCYLLQNFEAVLMKYSMVIAYNNIKSRGLDARFATMQHDEFQMIVIEDQAKEVGKILEDSMEEAGTMLGSRCIIKGAAEIGSNWMETH